MPLGDQHYLEHVRDRVEPPPRWLYKYTNAGTARAILTTRRLRHQSPLNYNDPFDSQWDPLWFVQTDDFVKTVRRVLDQALRDPGTWPQDMDPELRSALQAEVSQINALHTDHERDAARTRLIEEASNPGDAAHNARSSSNDIRKRMRVLCLCENDESLLMWSHYGEQHRGVVFGFDSEKLEQYYKRPIEKVSYNPDLPLLFDQEAWARSMIFGVPAPPLKHDRALVLTKSKCWEYEREWRFVWIAPKGTVGDHQDFDFPQDALVEVVFGCRTCKSTALELAELASEIQAAALIGSMELHPECFKLIKRRWRSKLHGSTRL